MSPSGPRAVVVVAIAVAVIVAVALLLFSPSHSAGAPSSVFNFSQNLPTGTTTSNGQQDCGANESASLTVPVESTVFYNLTVNTSGGSANVWDIIGSSHGFQSVSYRGMVHTELVVGISAEQIQFVFQGCGPSPTVALGFWGEIVSLPETG